MFGLTYQASAVYGNLLTHRHRVAFVKVCCNFIERVFPVREYLEFDYRGAPAIVIVKSNVRMQGKYFCPFRFFDCHMQVVNDPSVGSLGDRMQSRLDLYRCNAMNAERDRSPMLSSLKPAPAHSI